MSKKTDEAAAAPEEAAVEDTRTPAQKLKDAVQYVKDLEHSLPKGHGLELVHTYTAKHPAGVIIERSRETLYPEAE